MISELILRDLLAYQQHDDIPAAPSFPTRRSSDLSPAAGARRGRAAATARRHGPVGVVGRVRGARPGARERRAVVAHRDRKSTRLNSSHQIISYAVFCLKKKTYQR